MPRTRLRILSDLHYGEPPSRIADLAALRPLLDEPAHLVLNGDSVDTRFVDTDPAAAAGRARFLEFIAPWRDRLTLVTGNHDPDISPHHHLELAGGRVLVTHGDVLFPSVAPWGWEAAQVIAARERRLRELADEDTTSLETQLAVCKHSSYTTRHFTPPVLRAAGHGMARFMRLASRVRRADRILTAWFHTPGLAAGLAERHRPAAELVVIGHTHYPGVWRRGGRVVINTGAFTPPFAPLMVDFVEARVEVRIVVRKSGEFRVGPVRRTLEAGRDFGAPFFPER